jgi:Zn-dependent oligopeptidase
MEYFAREPSVIQRWARHYITGEVVPKQLLLDALEKKEDFAAIDLQTQILLAAADQVSV